MSDNKIDNGGPAFPLQPLDKGFFEGMTLLDYFAAKALPAIYSEAMRDAREGSNLFHHDDWRYGLALEAYALADAMLRARKS